MAEYDVVIVGGGIVGLYLARSCAEKGVKVCVVEKGGESDGAPQTDPPIRFSARRNLAAVEARNHILGGNSRYWGGALVEDDGALIDSLGITNGSVEVFHQASDVVYSKLGIRRTRRSKVLDSDDPIVLCEFPVLTGKWRHIWSATSSSLAAEGIRCCLNTEAIGIGRKDGRNTVLLRCGDGVEETIAFRSLVVSAGVVDSIRVLARLFPELRAQGLGLGMHLNDHLSFPVLSFPWKRTATLDNLFPPRFDKSVTVGRRLEFHLPDSGTRGFIHLQAPYDEVEPYRSLKRLVFARQLGLSVPEMISSGVSLMSGGVTTLRVGLDRFLAHRLFYPQGGKVNLLVDIESGAEPEKSFALDGEYILNWSLSDSDIEHLAQASLKALDLLGSEILDSEGLANARAEICSSGFAARVQENCTEALHLGGGVQAFTQTVDGLGIKCRLCGDLPAYVMSTAIFPRAGVANPVQTLMVCAEMLSQHLAKPERL